MTLGHLCSLIFRSKVRDAHWREFQGCHQSFPKASRAQRFIMFIARYQVHLTCDRYWRLRTLKEVVGKHDHSKSENAMGTIQGSLV